MQRSGSASGSTLRHRLLSVVVNDQLIRIGDSCDALLLEAGVGGYQAATAADEYRLE